MEPLFGGLLANPPQPIQELWDTAPTRRTAVEWALQWLWNQPEVSVVLSGMSSMQHVKENIVSADISEIGILTEEELALIDRVCDQYKELSPIPCTGCGYCLPCPQDVDIPHNFKLYNDGILYEKDRPDRTRFWYSWMTKGGFEGEWFTQGPASQCIQCRECEAKCPQNIPISETMPIVHQVLGEKKSYDECPLPAELKR
jgi:predicted aldo/keto reductase-like oxidoreductase